MCLSAYHGNAEEEEEEKKNNVNALVAKREIDSSVSCFSLFDPFQLNLFDARNYERLVRVVRCEYRWRGR